MPARNFKKTDSAHSEHTKNVLDDTAKSPDTDNTNESKQAKQTISPLEDHLGYWLRLASAQVSQGFSNKIAAHQINVAEWIVLRELYKVPRLTPSTLATQLSMTRGAISKIIEHLTHKKLVQRLQHISDNRSQHLQLSPAGQYLVPQLSTLANANEHQYFSQFTPSQQHLLRDLLGSIAKQQPTADTDFQK